MRKRLDGRCVIGYRRVHPGAILEEVLHGAEVSQNGLANAMGVSPRRINEILHGRRAITAQTALGLEEVLGLSAEYWMCLQVDYADHATRSPKAKQMRRGEGVLFWGMTPAVMAMGSAAGVDHYDVWRHTPKRDTLTMTSFSCDNHLLPHPIPSP